MPYYTYRCPVCDATQEVLLPMEERQAPRRPESIAATTCAADHAPTAMTYEWTPAAPAINRFNALPSHEKSAILAKRSSAHFEREGRDRKEQGHRDFLKKAHEAFQR